MRCCSCCLREVAAKCSMTTDGTLHLGAYPGRCEDLFGADCLKLKSYSGEALPIVKQAWVQLSRGRSLLPHVCKSK